MFYNLARINSAVKMSAALIPETPAGKRGPCRKRAA
jgi:hypothetical protein